MEHVDVQLLLTSIIAIGAVITVIKYLIDSRFESQNKHLEQVRDGMRDIINVWMYQFDGRIKKVEGRIDGLTTLYYERVREYYNHSREWYPREPKYHIPLVCIIND